MDLVHGRDLTGDDAETARLLIGQHQPCEPIRRAGKEIRWCASAMHQIRATAWSCDRYQWALWVLAAGKRGEITGDPSNVRPAV